MSMEDPFFVVKGEVQKAVNNAQGLHQRWMELLQDAGGASKEEVDWTTNELRNSLRSIEWDLEDLDETINILSVLMCENQYLDFVYVVFDIRIALTWDASIVESNPKKFNLDAMELAKRKAFITSTRQTVKNLKDHMTSPTGISVSERKNRQTLMGDSGSRGPIWQPSGDKYTRLDNELQSANSQFIEDQQTQQQLIAERQDEQLELVSGTIGILKNMSERVGQELDEQAVMLDDFSHDMDNTQSRLDSVMKKLAKVSHMTSDRRQWCAIGILLAILFVVIILFLVL
ncbi:syntaxin-6 [Triplophysa dalaica]|uniref:syntaxin-6 n=1 Tax=Triplophysa dalaica TaxID=1582913 RepID=UPI0024DF86EE|nr:syntaxin-6 [Triplophysa dalaica]